MEFYLTYEGYLKSNADPKHKHQIRKYFHKQLKNLLKLDISLKNRPNWKIEKIPNRINCIIQKNNFSFAPIITSKLHLVAELDIFLLWQDSPGKIIGNGDLDNKLKTLFDALSCPSSGNQLNKMEPAEDELPFYCLLEDDKLIQNIRVRTHTLLKECRSSKDLAITIRVKGKTIHTIWDNIGL